MGPLPAVSLETAPTLLQFLTSAVDVVIWAMVLSQFVRVIGIAGQPDGSSISRER